MAYMNQEKKKVIAAALKKVVPATWKYSLSVNNHSTIVMVIKSAPLDFSDKVDWFEGIARKEFDVNPYHFERYITCDALRDQVRAILDCLNIANFNNSDTMTDYHHVGHYVKLTFGAYGRPYTDTSAPQV